MNTPNEPYALTDGQEPESIVIIRKPLLALSKGRVSNWSWYLCYLVKGTDKFVQVPNTYSMHTLAIAIQKAVEVSNANGKMAYILATSAIPVQNLKEDGESDYNVR